jgi:hypothetical protein
MHVRSVSVHLPSSHLDCQPILVVVVSTLELLMRLLVNRLLDRRLRYDRIVVSTNFCVAFWLTPFIVSNRFVPDCSNLVRGLNMLMLKVLENADRTTSFHVLIKFLK